MKTYYGRISSIVSPNQKVQFLRVLETAEVRKRYPSEECFMLVTDYGNQIAPEKRTILDEDKLSGIEKVYYLNEEDVNFHFDYENEEIGEQQTRELEEKSILLWDAAADEKE